MLVEGRKQLADVSIEDGSDMQCIQVKRVRLCTFSARGNYTFICHKIAKEPPSARAHAQVALVHLLNVRPAAAAC